MTEVGQHLVGSQAALRWHDDLLTQPADFGDEIPLAAGDTTACQLTGQRSSVGCIGGIVGGQR